MKCSNCGAEMPDSAVFCASCGNKTESLAAACAQCQNPLKPGAKFCPKCGQATETAAPAAASCPQCGAAVASGLSFCPKCGNRLAAGSAPVYQQQYAPPPQYAPAYQQPVKRKSKGPLVAIIVVLVVLLGIGAYAMLVPNNPIKNIFLGPKGTYLAVEANDLKSTTSDLVSDLAKYGNKSSNEKGGFEVDRSPFSPAAPLETTISPWKSVKNIAALPKGNFCPANNGFR